MALDDNLRFRMTMWPGVPLPLPPSLSRRATYRLHDSGLALLGNGLGVEIGPEARVGEIYLELYGLDLEDTAAIVGFANRYGVPNGILLYYAVAGNSWFAGLFSPDEDLQFQKLVYADSEVQRQADPTWPDWDLTEVTTLASFRFAARFIRDLTDAWRIVSGDLDGSAHEWQLAYQAYGQTTRSWFFAVQLLSWGLTALVRQLHPYLMVTQSEEEPPPPEEREAWEPPPPSLALPVRIESAPTPTFWAHLAQFCALELFNHIAGSEVYRRCQNENCGSHFVRQYGRAEHGQSKRQGVMYCSYHCAQAAASRKYRRRKSGRAA